MAVAAVLRSQELVPRLLRLQPPLALVRVVSKILVEPLRSRARLRRSPDRERYLLPAQLSPELECSPVRVRQLLA